MFLCFCSDYSGAENPTSFYGEFSVCSDGPANVNQYEKIGKLYLIFKFNKVLQ